MSIERETARTIDLSSRSWGRNYEVLRFEKKGWRLKIALWSSPMPEIGDYLLLAGNGKDGKTQYRVINIEPCWNPRDMAVAVVDFYPRAGTAA